MARVPASEFQREFGRLRGVAHRAAVIVTSHGRDDADGSIDPDTGKMLMECLSTLQGIHQVDQLAERMADIEATLLGRHS